MMKIFKKLLPVLILFLLCLGLAIANYLPGTYLSGWDNLHPEFNFKVNLERAIFAPWQEYQGTGLLGGMGHAADLIRVLLLWPFSFILPLSLIRYFFHFSMLFLGPLGIYFLINRLLEKTENRFVGLAGALFYLFNLATLQAFYVPFEAFSIHFAVLPWLFLTILAFLKKGDKKSLWCLFLINFLAVPQGYVATYFLVYFLALSVVLTVFFIQQRNLWKRILVVYSLVFLVNAFWLLPNLYFVWKNVGTNLEAKINLMATGEIFLKNQKYGTLGNAALLKGFWFDNVEINQAGVPALQMGEWVDYFKKTPVMFLGYLLFGVSLLGIIASIKKRNMALVFLLPFVLGFILLANDTPIFSNLVGLFYKIPLFKQIFRFPFTKFSVLTAFCLSLFYTGFLSYLLSIKKKRIFNVLLVIIFSLLPVAYLFPVFEGKLFYSREKAKIPEEYFQLFDFFAREDSNSRIANFPQASFWSWGFYRFDYSGSGFLWYGIKQPIMDRAFDVWGKQNENYYWEISYALYSKNQELFEKVLEKYQVNWVLVDENLINPGEWRALGFDELSEMLSSEKFSLVKSFKKIKVYKVNLEIPVKNFVFLANDLPAVNHYEWGNLDQAYLDYGNYYSPLVSHFSPSIYYPFRSLFTGRDSQDLDFIIKDEVDRFVFTKKLPPEVADYKLQIPELTGRELAVVDQNNLANIRFLIPEVYDSGEDIEVIIPKVRGYFSGTFVPDPKTILPKAKNCSLFNQGEVGSQIIGQGEGFSWRFTSSDAKNCNTVLSLPNLSHQYGYLIGIKNHHLSGKNLLFWLENISNRKADFELYLAEGENFLIQPPMAEDGLGYSLHLDNDAIGRQKTVNDLKAVTINPIPYEFLTGIALVPSDQQEGVNPAHAKSVIARHPNLGFYEVEVPADESGVLVLSQAYHQSWKAYLPTGKEIKEHVLVNNWENGWVLEGKQSKIYLIFWPQYLEYLGFGLLGVALIWVAVSRRRA